MKSHQDPHQDFDLNLFLVLLRINTFKVTLVLKRASSSTLGKIFPECKRTVIGPTEILF